LLRIISGAFLFYNNLSVSWSWFWPKPEKPKCTEDQHAVEMLFAKAKQKLFWNIKSSLKLRAAPGISLHLYAVTKIYCQKIFCTVYKHYKQVCYLSDAG